MHALVGLTGVAPCGRFNEPIAIVTPVCLSQALRQAITPARYCSQLRCQWGLASSVQLSWKA
eukprot:2637317-Amphidinium_carterae.1